MILKPYYPATGMYRISRDLDNLQVDFMYEIDGISSLEGLRKRAKTMKMGSAPLMVAALADIIRSKKAAGRPKDIAVIGILEKTLAEATTQSADGSQSAKKAK